MRKGLDIKGLRSAVLGLVFAGLACSSYGQPTGWTGRIETRSGVEHIFNPSEGLWDKDDSNKITVERIFSIGEVYSGREELFSWVKDVATDRDGNIYGCDSKLSRIQVFDDKGKYLRTICRAGKGPGDLLRPMAVCLDTNGKLYVLDDLNNRVSVLKTDGKFLTLFKFHYYGFAHESIIVNAEGHVCLSHILFNDDKKDLPLITEYGPDGKLAREYGMRKILLRSDGSGRPVWESYGFCLTKDGVLLVKSSNPYTIQVFENGRQMKVIHRDSPIFTLPETGRMVYKPVDGPAGEVMAVKLRSSVWEILPMPDGKFITVIRDAGKNFRENSNERDFSIVLDLFDRNGFFLKSYPWDWQKDGLLLYVDRDGYFYSNIGATPVVPGITKWKVTFD
jgi:hypothetical protein